MNIVFKCLNLLLKIISGHLGILNSGSDHELIHTESNGFFLVLSFPHETILFNLENLSSKGIQISFFTPWLHIPDNQGLFNNDLFLFGTFLSLGSSLSGSLLSFLIIFTEKVKIIVVFLLSFLLLGLLLLLFFTLSLLLLTTFIFTSLGLSWSGSLP